jgi:hypothetical protein
VPSTGSSIYELQPRFAALFDGLDTAFGTGAGRWVHRAPTAADWVAHLAGTSAGIGIAPLRPDSKVMFAAIDLDEPDFEAARLMQSFIPGPSFIERSRSGNAHIFVFFSSPIEAWVPMGVLKEVTLAADKPHVEVFPKNHDFSKVKLGSYINLPYYGNERPILFEDEGALCDMDLEDFLDRAEARRNEPKDWRSKAQWMLITPPEQRERHAEFGKQSTLHICAEHILSGDAGPVVYGHRSIVYFSLAKMLCNWEHCDHDEAAEFLRSVNEDAGPDSIPDEELMRILGNAERGQFTSTGCDDPTFLPYAHPDCPIAYPRR